MSAGEGPFSGFASDEALLEALEADCRHIAARILARSESFAPFALAVGHDGTGYVIQPPPSAMETGQAIEALFALASADAATGAAAAYAIVYDGMIGAPDSEERREALIMHLESRLGSAFLGVAPYGRASQGVEPVYDEGFRQPAPLLLFTSGRGAA